MNKRSPKIMIFFPFSMDESVWSPVRRCHPYPIWSPAVPPNMLIPFKPFSVPLIYRDSSHPNFQISRPFSKGSD